MTDPFNGGSDYLDDEFESAMKDYNQGRKPLGEQEEVETFTGPDSVGQEDTDHLIGDERVPPGGLTGQVQLPEVEEVRVEDFETLQRLASRQPPEDGGA